MYASILERNWLPRLCSVENQMLAEKGYALQFAVYLSILGGNVPCVF